MTNERTETTPTSLKLAKGNPAHRRINHAEPVSYPARRAAPARLTGRANEVWNRLVDELVVNGTLTIVDEYLYEQHCEVVGEIIELKENLRTLAFNDPDARQHLIHSANLRTLHVKLAAELGLSPTSRSRITAAPPRTAQESARAAVLERYFGRTNESAL
jgi:P27 family predicted phage terminase small subunit